MLDKNEIRNALRDVMDPEIHQSIVDLNMVRKIVVEGNNVTVDLALTIAGCPMQSEIKTSVEEKVKGLPGVESVKVNLGVMDEDEKKALMEHLHGPKKTSPLLEPDSKTKIVMVASGKGGVGKSTVTVNLAVALARQGLKVGILDADIYGFSIPRMIGATQQPTALDENTIIPVETRGIKLISMGSFVNEDVPVVWRGPLLMKALEQFLTDVLWGDLDYLLLDSPPGTGDIAISVMQMLPRARVLIVTTPQVSAYKVAGRVGRLAQELKLELLGVVENMSYFICDNCGKEHNIFGEGGGEITAKELNAKLLARIPLGAEIRVRGDNGEPLAVESTESPAGKEFENMAKAVTQLWS